MMTTLHRHDMVFLTPSGQECAWRNRDNIEFGEERYRALFYSLPGICRSPSPCLPETMAALGFSLPLRRDGSRMRVSSCVPKAEIVKVISPWDIVPLASGLPGPVGLALPELMEAAEQTTIHLGIFGSAALQAVTGCPYLHERSDLDVVITPASEQQLYAFYGKLMDISQKYSLKIDVELMVDESCYVKLHELIQGAKSVLAKGSTVPKLIPRQKILDAMAAKPR